MQADLTKSLYGLLLAASLLSLALAAPMSDTLSAKEESRVSSKSGEVKVSHYSYTPIEIYVANIPLGPGNYFARYSLEGNSEIANAKDILVYAFNTLHDTTDRFWRGYYEIYTQAVDGTKYKGYMNTANPGEGTTIDSVNVWLPYGSFNGVEIEQAVYVSLTTFEGNEVEAMHQFKMAQLFITGYLE